MLGLPFLLEFKGWAHLVLDLVGPKGFGLFVDRIGGLSLDVMSEGMVLDPNWANYGFGTVLEVGVQQQHL